MSRLFKCSLLVMVMTIFLTVSTEAYGADNTVRVYVDGREAVLDTAPVIENGRILVSVRGVFEKLGADVRWDEYAAKAYIKDEYNEIVMVPDMNRLLLNGQVTKVDTYVRMSQSRVMVPLRFIAESLGHRVEWNAAERSVYISSQPPSPSLADDMPVIGSAENLAALLRLGGDAYEYYPSVDFEESVLNSPEAEKAAGSTSNTNVQVEGVDEGDIVKTDGKYIYIAFGSSVKIIDSDPESPSVAAEIQLPGSTSVSEIYVQGTHMAVLGNEWSGNKGIMYPDASDYYSGWMHSMSRCRIAIYDISDVSKPVLRSQYLADGSYISSRVTGGRIYVVTSSDIYDNVKTYLPGYEDCVTGSRINADFGAIRYFPYSTPRSYMITLATDMAGGSEADMTVCVASPDSIYMTSDNLYVASGGYRMGYGFNENRAVYGPVTSIYKFAVTGSGLKLRAHADMPGSLLNQFSMDEYDGVFRAAVTNDSGNSIYTFDADMKETGSLQNLAPGERIYSTRFMGDRIYMVTFKEVDPLFVIDASGPEDLKVLGYLKIPGYSSYLHPVSEGRLLGFGYDTQVNAWGGVTNGGVKISLFDVANVASPKELHTEILGGPGSYTPVTENHKALTYSQEGSFMALPVTEVDNGEILFDGSLVYDIAPMTFSERCRFANEDIAYGYMGTEKIIYIGNYFYTFSGPTMRVYEGRTGEPLSELDFGLNIK